MHGKTNPNVPNQSETTSPLNGSTLLYKLKLPDIKNSR